MSISKFGRADWKAVARELDGVASHWWTDHREHLVDIGRAEIGDLAVALRGGDLTQAKLELVARMSPEEWAAYRDGTTAKLRELARRRAALLEALEDLGRRAAQLIGQVLARVLGLAA